MTPPAGHFRVGKRFSFDASHQLPGLLDGHKCARLHGHTYTVEIVVAADMLTDPGFVTDFGDLAPLRAYLDDEFDHRHLNEVLAAPPTAENLAAHLARWCHVHLEPLIPGQVVAVRVSETPTSWAIWEADPR
ncbi:MULTISPECIES: 6-pyruvoyl trahydropterin synthase family protein [Pseudofrankia]|uniref:6-pyruvoyl trahydropterin synthase family protein n=1 Tax=Pseudofrankia TaxID=2994363 RepID=UPI000480D47A|nr:MULTISPECIES: 6-pyruvoyl tetrahydropterin synthase family protein [Pseudofrankia]OHV27524.1 6-carboxytetrahydropterin synthase QueD [Pseudofrankia sp. EUN1h]